jgi:broad specificity phosphatase PhoE
MSDLFCAATLLVTRHGEAEYDEPGVASDDGGSLTIRGRQQSHQLADSLRDRRIAAIWCSDMSQAVQTAEIVAAELGVPVGVRAGLREFSVGELAGQPLTAELFKDVFAAWMVGDLSVGCPGAGTGSDVVRRVSDELQSLADQFRGETALVISHGGSMSLVLPRLVRNVEDDFATGRPLDNCAPCEIAADADGWMLRTWNGEPLDVASG